MSSELFKRIYTSILLVLVVLICLFLGDISWLLLLIFISLICFYEFLNILIKIFEKKFLLFLLGFLSLCYLIIFIFFAYKLKTHFDPEVILLVLMICISSDIGGFIVGKTVGGIKLTKISPNKTLSGSFGSFIFSIIIPYIFVNILLIYNKESLVNLNLTFIYWVLLISLSCQIGDLFISFFKRKAKVKDTGNILPGHGGMLDRVDGILFAVPIAWAAIILSEKIIFLFN